MAELELEIAVRGSSRLAGGKTNLTRELQLEEIHVLVAQPQRAAHPGNTEIERRVLEKSFKQSRPVEDLSRDQSGAVNT